MKVINKLIDFLKTIRYIKNIEIQNELSKEDRILLEIMKESERSGYLTDMETEKFLKTYRGEDL